MNSEAAGARQVTYMDGFKYLGGVGTVAHWQVSKSICIHSPTKPNKLAVDFSLRLTVWDVRSTRVQLLTLLCRSSWFLFPCGVYPRAVS